MLIITGTGRCGTSCVAKLAKALGHDPGGTWDGKINAGFEVGEVSRLNDQIAQELQSEDASVVAARHRVAIERVRQLVLKDPRFVARPGVLEVWLEVRKDLEFLVLYRNPHATAVSSAQTFNRDGTPMALAETMRKIEENFQRAIGILAERAVPFYVANFPTIVVDREYCRRVVCVGPLRNTDPLAFNRAWRDTVRQELVHHPAEKSIDLIGSAMRPGGPGYEYAGNLYAKVLIGEIGTGKNVIDIGCGYGRVADPLARKDQVANYTGYDCFPPAALECSRRFELNPRFFFQHLNIFSARYNPTGEPLRDGSLPELGNEFDGALAISLFTHLAPDDAATMLREAYRMLAPGGRLIATWFLAGPDTGEIAKAPGYRGPLRVEVSPGVWTSGGLLENAVGYSREMVHGWYASAGFKVTAEAEGMWRGGTGEHFQDLLIARKP